MNFTLTRRNFRCQSFYDYILPSVHSYNPTIPEMPASLFSLWLGSCTRMLLGNFEDPATGSSAISFAAYLSLVSQQPEDKIVFDYDIVQGIEMGRKSDIGVHVVLRGDKKGSRESGIHRKRHPSILWSNSIEL
ncbi:hypothetical protein N7447_003542, partial [Penicillium robsamsonii]|uniref:uncharacterized protein n=1 Tax=Penicillium robsamsonii TaxID=1792511 RepID=UPI00254923A9